MLLPNKKPYSIKAKIKVFNKDFDIYKDKLNSFRGCIDIGSHVGIYALKYSKIFYDVYCFEPSPFNFKMLKENTKHRGNIKTYNYGISSKKELLNFIHDDYNTEMSFIKKSQRRSIINTKKKKYYTSTVECYPLDYFNFNEIDFIKIDTEGYIMPVLEGMIETIKRNKPIIQLEDFDQLESRLFFKELNYEKFKLNQPDSYYEYVG